MEHKTRLAKLEDRLPMRIHVKSRFEQLRVPRLQERYAADTVFASIPSYEGYKDTQIYAEGKSGRKEVYGLRTEA